jgi:prepilin-type N-terminal cleavage/methylation domain-containing protein
MKKGFSLVEVLVFVTILSLFFVAAMAVTTYSLRTMKTNQYKILAAHFAEEGLEWLRGQKEDDWTTFSVYDSSLGPATYCISNLDFSSPGECGENYTLGTPQIFKREVTLENIPDSSDPDQVNATVMVVWNGGDEVTVKTIFKLLE